MPASQLKPKVAVPTEVLAILQSRVAMETLCEAYMLSVQSWLPMISKKRLFERVAAFNETTDIGLSLLLLCMKLVSEAPFDGEHAAASSLYCMVKEFYFRVETAGAISLQLLQSAILISVYELGHALYPAAYLSVSNAERLGTMMGYHDRKNTPQLFKDADTWTEREEERRSWWAIVILERYNALGIPGLPLASPEPVQGTLLPCTESMWDLGQIGSNLPLFASSLSPSVDIGSFASMCQACHILGLVLRHRAGQQSATDAKFRVTEAWQLHQILVSLHTHLTDKFTTSMNDSSTMIAIAFCSSARITLYNIYACNEHDSAVESRLLEETQMQAASIEGLREVCQDIIPLAHHISVAATSTVNDILSKSLLLCHCLYHVASEYAWFIREERAMEKVSSLKIVVEVLSMIGTRWRVAGEYIKNLEDEGDLDAISG
ncbi:hypothetical protein FQN54_004547 [Arachnomyces sp. PD_36]|nr:hypothetical protein FQN54_004547 [Arachnomyces sp. PD_36]